MHTLVLSSLLTLCPIACPPETSDPGVEVAVGMVADDSRPVVDLAICLDTSGSMNGLIDSAKAKLWEIVNDLALAKPTPRLRVALLTFGNDGHLAENGWVNVDSEFTEDLDLVSQRLFALSTNGGTELVGRVLSKATDQLQWTPGDQTLKIIVVAGNESADQDQEVPFRDIARKSIGKGIVVNSIYCGNPTDSLAPAWKEISTLADGHFASIDKDNGTIIVTTPFDDDLASLSAALNDTYIPFGAVGGAAWANQREQDVNASKLSSAVAAQRCVTKAGAMYDNRGWDMVDACKQPDFKLEDVKDEELPEVMRPMTIEQRREYVRTKESERANLQTKVSDLQVKREQYVQEEMKKSHLDDSNAFDAALRKAIRAQAESRGLKFEPPAAAQPEAAPAPQPETASATN